MSEYWTEHASIALDEAGISGATADQIEAIAGVMESAHDFHAQAHGHDVASVNFHAAEEKQTNRLKAELDYEKTVPRDRCDACEGKGNHKDGWGREFGCRECDGKGIKPIYPFRMKGAAP